MKKNLFTHPVKGLAILLSATMLFTSVPDMHVMAAETVITKQESVPDEAAASSDETETVDDSSSEETEAEESASSSEEESTEDTDTEETDIEETDIEEADTEETPSEEQSTSKTDPVSSEADEEEDARGAANGRITPVTVYLTLNYDTAGGEINEDYQTVYEYTHGVITLPVNVQREHYSFLGWYETVEHPEIGGDKEVRVTEIPANETGKRSFHAKWQGDTYEISYDLDGGSFTTGAAVEYVHTYGETMKLPESRFMKKDGAVFAGWLDVTEGLPKNESEDGSEEGEEEPEDPYVHEIGADEAGERVYLAAWEEASVIYVDEATDFNTAWNAAKRAGDTTIILAGAPDQQINLTDEYTLSDGIVTIDLNGRKICGCGEKKVFDDSDFIFRVEKKGELIIKDGSEEETGRIWVDPDNTDYDEVIDADDGGKLVLQSGIIKGNSDEDCRLIVVEDGALFTMEGGMVGGNRYLGNGAGVYIDEGSFTMKGGTIANNSAASSRMGIGGCGGGIYYDGGTGTKLTIRDGMIIGNSADLGGAIYLDDGESWISGGTICSNEADKGGGIYVAYTAEVPWTIDDVEIFMNTARKCGGGIFLGGSLMWIQEMYFDYQCIYENTNGDVGRSTTFGGCEVVFTNDPLSRYEGYNWISYERNDGEIEQDYEICYTEIQKEEDIIRLPELVVREGQHFAGWYENETFSGKKATEIGIYATGDKCFYAKWEKAFDSIAGPQEPVYKNMSRAGKKMSDVMPYLDAAKTVFTWENPAESGIELYITDESGAVVKQEKVTEGEQSISVNLNDVPDGLYKAELVKNAADGTKQYSDSCVIVVRGIYTIEYELDGGEFTGEHHTLYVSGEPMSLPTMALSAML